MRNNFFVVRLLITSLGIVITFWFSVLFTLIERYYELVELFGVGENVFAIFSFVLTLVLFYFLYNNGEKYFSALIFSVVYYFFIPNGVLQLMFYGSNDGQIAMAIFPIYILLSIFLFFIH